MWPRIASAMAARASSRVSPLETHPGKSGTQTLMLPSSAGSRIATYAIFPSLQDSAYVALQTQPNRLMRLL